MHFHFYTSRKLQNTSSNYKLTQISEFFNVCFQSDKLLPLIFSIQSDQKPTLNQNEYLKRTSRWHKNICDKF